MHKRVKTFLRVTWISEKWIFLEFVIRFQKFFFGLVWGFVPWHPGFGTLLNYDMMQVITYLEDLWYLQEWFVQVKCLWMVELKKIMSIWYFCCRRLCVRKIVKKGPLHNFIVKRDTLFSNFYTLEIIFHNKIVWESISRIALCLYIHLI